MLKRRWPLLRDVNLSPGSLVVLAALAVVLCAGYVWLSRFIYAVGFPLDDAWIHQTYARNLALGQGWVYWPGEPSGGSTSPMWTLVLALGHLLGGDVYLWTYVCGGVCLAGLGLIGELFFRKLKPGAAHWIPWVGLLLVSEWHLTWAAVSGMETGLFALLILSVMLTLTRSQRNGWLTGGLIGLTLWVRPDAVTLLGPAVLVFALSPEGMKVRLVHLAKLAGGFAVGLATYVGFNLWLSGSLLPNTFYAKQAEYAAQLQFPLLERVGGLLGQVMVGGGVLLLPGFIFLLWQSGRQRNWVVLGSAAWWLGYAGLYALRLPVIYQHGRYMMPAMPVYLVLGAVGTAVLLDRIARGVPWQKLLRFGWQSGMALLWLIFTAVGAWTYAGDVAIIESEMVVTGRWISANTAPDALIAAHDIGAVGYFGQRRLVDLAGLVSPEVIPYIRDETWLMIYLDERQVSYLVTFPNWYIRLASHRDVLFTTQGNFAPAAGGENMTVFFWP